MCLKIREASCQLTFRDLVKGDPAFYVPDVIAELSTKRVLTSELVHGKSLDDIVEMDQETRNWV